MEFSHCRFEQQQAKITISKLQCEAYEDKSLKMIVGKLNETIVDMKTSGEERMGEMETTLEEKFGNLEEVLEEKTEKLENASFPLFSPFECPTSKSSYFKLIDNVCYYFESQSLLTYRNAQQNCKIIFGLHGHLFEPATPEKSRQIYKLSRTISTYGFDWWVGFDSIGRNSNQWRYASSGDPLIMTTEGYSNLNSANQCAYLNSSNGTAYDSDCITRNGLYSICETKNVKQE